jgi:hypothetical protein
MPTLLCQPEPISRWLRRFRPSGFPAHKINVVTKKPSARPAIISRMSGIQGSLGRRGLATTDLGRSCRAALGLLRACHPGPTLAVTVLTTAVAAASGRDSAGCGLVAGAVLTCRVELPAARRPHAVMWTGNRFEHWQRTRQRPAVAVWTAAQTAQFLRQIRGRRLPHTPFAAAVAVATVGIVLLLGRGPKCSSSANVTK